MLTKAFARSAAKPEGSSSQNLIEAICAERPDLNGQTAYFPGPGLLDPFDDSSNTIDGHQQGIYSYTVFIGDEIFKAPRLQGMIEVFDAEMRILQELADKGLPVPEVTCAGSEAAFFGMTRMPGILAGEDLTETLTPDEQRQLAKDIVGFVINMANALPVENGKFTVHDDLHFNNIFIDPETKRLTGVIDFGQVKQVKSNGWKPHEAFPESFRKLLRAEYNLRKNELPAAPEVKKAQKITVSRKK